MKSKGYTIGETAVKTGLTPYTIRYYDKEGLISAMERDKNGNRIFNEMNIEEITIICCLKETGMSVKNIREFMDLQAKGNETLHKRDEILKKHKEFVLKSIENLYENLRIIDEKLEYFERACKAYDDNKEVPICPCKISEK